MQSTTRTLLGCIGILVLAGALGAACSAAGNGGQGSSGGSGGSGASGSGTGGGSPAGTGGGETTLASGTGGATSSGGFGGSCAGVSSEATSEAQPADIIIAVDTSGSMDEESAEVQQNLNNFASIITSSGIDVHVILIAAPEVCIPAPLGSGACGGVDENLPAYRHVQQVVNSTDALQLIVSTYPQWKDALRPNATKTVAVVSDDNSDLGAGDFSAQLLALDPPTFQGFKFDAIVSFDSPDVCAPCILMGNCAACTSACCSQSFPCQPISAAEGTVYKQLVQQTGGVIGDLCEQDFDPVFTDMATAVVTGSTISCEYAIPEPPEGETFEPTKVNVAYTPGSGSTQTIGNVPGGLAACTPQAGGWYYDDPQNPTKIVLCPTTCTAVQGGQSGKVEVQFGCDTVPAVPE